jgi:TetR/AcrR family transcriptional regulator, transcriptional repressor for nem operon
MSLSPTTIRRRGRPPADASVHNETRALLLRAGIEILTEKGFSATGLDEILKRVCVPKGSFYHYFKSKDDFGYALINKYDAYFSHKLDKFLLDETLPPLQRIRAFITDAEEGMARHQFRRGCLIGNLGQEMGSLSEHFREQIKTVFRNWQLKLEHCLLQAKADRQIPQSSDCKMLSEVFWIGWEGAVLRAKLELNADALQAFSKFYFVALNAASTNSKTEDINHV